MIITDGEVLFIMEKNQEIKKKKLNDISKRDITVSLEE